VIQHGLNDLETLGNSFRRAREIDNQSLISNSGDSPGQHCGGSLRSSLAAHRFGDSRSLPINNSPRRFRSVVALGEAGAPGGKNEIDVVSLGQNVQRVADVFEIIRYDQLAFYRRISSKKELCKRVAGNVVFEIACVADG